MPGKLRNFTASTMARSCAKDFTLADKAKVKTWREVGVSCKEIARMMGRSEVGVRRLYRTLKDLPASAQPPPPRKAAIWPPQADDNPPG